MPNGFETSATAKFGLSWLRGSEWLEGPQSMPGRHGRGVLPSPWVQKLKVYASVVYTVLILGVCATRAQAELLHLSLSQVTANHNSSAVAGVIPSNLAVLPLSFSDGSLLCFTELCVLAHQTTE